MDPSSESSAGNPPRRELQGPRPAPLRVNKDSHKIKKPVAAPPHHQPEPQRKPMVYYEVSPKVINVKPCDFMDLVQRLTGYTAAATSSSSNDGEVSPAARFATIEKARSPVKKKPGDSVVDDGGNNDVMEIVEGVDVSGGLVRTLPGILSPGPSSIPPIPGNFFSPPSFPPFQGNFFSQTGYSSSFPPPIPAAPVNSFPLTSLPPFPGESSFSSSSSSLPPLPGNSFPESSFARPWTPAAVPGSSYSPAWDPSSLGLSPVPSNFTPSNLVSPQMNLSPLFPRDPYDDLNLPDFSD